MTARGVADAAFGSAIGAAAERHVTTGEQDEARAIAQTAQGEAAAEASSEGRRRRSVPTRSSVA